MKKLIITLLLIFSLGSLRAQVGFNNVNPDPSSLLDLNANDKGLLVPRMTSAQRSAIGSPGQSLLVFDTNLQGFYFYGSGIWYSLNEWVRAAGSNDVTLSGNASVTGNFSSGSISNAGGLTTSSVSAGSLSVSGFATNALVPSGAIMMWSGSIASIPGGWALCDGSPGRPDLRGKFIVGYNASDGDYNSVGNQGGEKRHTLTVAEMPSHSHSVNDPGHLHSFPGVVPDGRGGDGGKAAEPVGRNTNTAFTGISINGNGGGGDHENRPPYYTLAYIIKL
jgi:microcystin-dependent protein